AVVDEFPFLTRDFAAGVALAVAHGQPSFGLVGRGCGIGEPPRAAVARRAGADMELVADAPHDRLAVVERRRELGAEPAIGAWCARVPARPHQRVAAPE